MFDLGRDGTSLVDGAGAGGKKVISVQNIDSTITSVSHNAVLIQLYNFFT